MEKLTVFSLILLSLCGSFAYTPERLPGDYISENLNFEPAGPFAVKNGQVEGIEGSFVAGSVNRVLPHPTNPDILYVGTTNGGIWKTTDSYAHSPEWVPLSDDFQAMSIGALEFDYSDDQYSTLIAGIAGVSSALRYGGLHVGLYVSKDAGQSWNLLGSNDLYGYRIQGVAMYKDTIVACAAGKGIGGSRIMYENGGVFRSIDGGENFEKLELFANRPCTDLVVDANNPSHFYIASLTHGVYYTNNAGEDWTNLLGGNLVDTLQLVSNNIRLSLYSNNGDIRVVAGIIDSSTEGVGAVLRFTLQNDETWDMEVLPNPLFLYNDTLYFLHPEQFHDDEDEQEHEDDLEELLEGGGQGSIHFSIAVDPTNPDIIYFGGDTQYPSLIDDSYVFPNTIGATTYCGISFRMNLTAIPDSPMYSINITTPLTHMFTASNSAPHSDSRHMRVDANGNLIESDDGGVYRRVDPNSNSGDWYSLNGNLQILEGHSATLAATEPYVWVTGNQDTGTTIGLANGKIWDTFTGGDGGVVQALEHEGNIHLYSTFPYLGLFFHTRFVKDLEQLPELGDEIYEADGVVIDTDNFTMESVDLNLVLDGNVLGSITDIIQVGFYQKYKINRYSPNRLFIGVKFGFLSYESFSFGKNVSSLENIVDSTETDVADAVYGGEKDGIQNPDLLIVVGEENFAIRETMEKGFEVRVSWPPKGITFGSIVAVSVHPENYHHIVVLCKYGEVAISKDAGYTWEVLPPVGIGQMAKTDSVQNYIQVVPTKTRTTIVVGSAAGLYFYQDTNAIWKKVGGLPNAYISELNYYPEKDVLYVATLGRGVWYKSNAVEAFDATAIDEPTSITENTIDPTQDTAPTENTKQEPTENTENTIPTENTKQEPTEDTKQEPTEQKPTENSGPSADTEQEPTEPEVTKDNTQTNSENTNNDNEETEEESDSEETEEEGDKNAELLKELNTFKSVTYVLAPICTALFITTVVLTVMLIRNKRPKSYGKYSPGDLLMDAPF
eukprot:TRINITY_DN7619_c0_g1_i1.p1 TRINITY_DN7619_c0_g1~~TRINITY_DN7619_c0_g1_i1.p1  ORF type:complete len:1005 (-),score=296.45 TRINITY_DN7619_c0_g1_i1:28-3042(-)